MQSSTCKRKFSVDLLLRVLSPSFGVVLELSYSYFRCRSPLKVSPSTDDVARARVALGLELLKVSGRERGLISPLPLRGFQPLEEQSVSFRVLSVFAFPLRLTQKGRFSPAKQFKGED